MAGLEPENTNEFLQAIGKAIERKINSNEAVAAVKNGTTAELEKSKKTATKSKTEKTKDTAPAGPAKKKTPIDSNKKGTAGNKIKGDDAKANVKNAAENKKSKAKPTKQGSVSKEDKPVEKPKKRAEKTTSEISLDDAKKDVVQLPAKPIEPPIDIKAAEPEVNAVEDKSAEPPPVVEPTEPVPPPENRDNDANDSIAVKSEEKPMLIKADSVEKSESSIPVKAVEIPVGSDANKEHKKQKETAKVREKRSPPLKPKHKPDDPPLSNGPLISKSSSIEVPMPKPVTALRSAAVRPVSARPSAPRRRDRNVKQITNHDSLMHDAVEPKKPEKRKNLMNEYEEGENIIITDIIQEAAAATNESDVIVDKIADGKQGHLVQQILDTQSAFMSNDADTKKNDTNVSIDNRHLIDHFIAVTFCSIFRRQAPMTMHVHRAHATCPNWGKRFRNYRCTSLRWANWWNISRRMSMRCKSNCWCGRMRMQRHRQKSNKRKGEWSDHSVVLLRIDSSLLFRIPVKQNHYWNNSITNWPKSITISKSTRNKSTPRPPISFRTKRKSPNWLEHCECERRTIYKTEPFDGLSS